MHFMVFSFGRKPIKDYAVVGQLPSHVGCFATPWSAACQAFLSFTISWNLLKSMPTESVMLSNHLSLCRPLLQVPSIFPSIRVFSNESALHNKWAKDWSFSFSISPSSEYSGLISFRMDCFELFTVQGLSRVFSNTAIWKHQFFSAQPSWQSSSRISTWLLKKLRIMNGFSLL